MNASLLSLTASESFTNDAAGFVGSFYPYPAQCACTAASIGLEIYFDVTTHGYTVTSEGETQTFLPSDLDSDQSSASVNVYTVGNDTLSLTNPGASGALTYKYVGAGFWQRQTFVSDATGDHTDLDYRAFTYGVETPDSQLPRTGSAGYAIDLVGAIGGEVPSILSGTGTLAINFGSGALTTSGDVNERSLYDGSLLSIGTFTGTATLSSSTNAFAGSLALDVNGTLSGALNGRFYGPIADEVGAVWSVADSSGRAATGTITGRLDDSIPLAASKAPVADTVAALAVSYDAASQSYTLTGGDRTIALGLADRDAAGSSATFNLFRKTLADGVLEAHVYNAAGSPLALSYTSFAELVFRGTDGTTQIAYQPFGQRTADAQMPRTGSASYTGAIFGSGAVQGAASNAFYTLGGTSRLDVDFAANRASGTLAITGSNAGGSRDFGSIGFQSYAMSSGTFAASPTGGATGSVNGAFYGPNAQEFGANFAIRQGYANGDTATLTGVTIGKKAP